MSDCAVVSLSDQGSGFCVTGKIEAGYIQTGDRILAMPPNETCNVKGFDHVFSFDFYTNDCSHLLSWCRWKKLWFELLCFDGYLKIMMLMYLNP